MGGGRTESPLGSMGRHWKLTAMCTLLGLVLGLLAALVLPRPHAAEARVAVVADTNNAYTIAGYPLAARELAADYARWVQNNASGGTWAPAGVSEVTASPIPDSTTIRIEVAGDSEQAAVEGADQVATSLVEEASQAQSVRDPEAAFEEYNKLLPALAEARADVDAAQATYGRAVGSNAAAATVRQARNALESAQVELSQVQLRTDAQAERYRRLYADTSGASTLKVIAPATSTGTGAESAFMRLGLVGAGTGFLVGFLLSVLRDRRRDAARPRP